MKKGGSSNMRKIIYCDTFVPWLVGDVTGRPCAQNKSERLKRKGAGRGLAERVAAREAIVQMSNLI